MRFFGLLTILLVLSAAAVLSPQIFQLAGKYFGEAGGGKEDSGVIVRDVMPRVDELTADELASPEPSTVSSVEQVREVNAPPPLKVFESFFEDERASRLTAEGVINWTNVERSKRGLPLLKESAELSRAARRKVLDMFENQYFDHVSSDGTDAGDLAESAGYEFIAIGENLALGNFAGDQDVVAAWMASPGHRENILSGKYTEIGVAVSEGLFDGRTTWIAVEEFGMPRSACPEPDESLKTEINGNERELNAMLAEIGSRKEELERLRGNRKKFNENVAAYNEFVEAYNALVAETKELVARYNGQVLDFNACAR